LGQDFDYKFGRPGGIFDDGVFEDGGGAADGFVDGGGLHVDGVVYAAAIPEGNFAVLDWQGCAFAVEEGEEIVANSGGGKGEGFLQGLKPSQDMRVTLGLKPQPPKEKAKTRALKWTLRNSGQGLGTQIRVRIYLCNARRNRRLFVCVLLIEGNMATLWLAALILGSVFAIAGAQGVKWKLLNAAIILGCMGLGLGIGYAAGLGSKNMGMVRDAAIPFAMIFGIVGAMVCVAQNNSRTKA